MLFEHRYKTERGFHAAMKRFGDRVAYWYGSDHDWCILVRRR